MSWDSIVVWFKKYFTPTPKPIETTTQPVEANPLSPNEIDWNDWTARAMKIVGGFEGTGEDWGNPTGNFDGAYLTCGLLGFTWKYNNQPPMILDFVKKFGEARAKQLMPKSWSEYYKAAKLGESGGSSIVASWSNGKATVSEPYRSELSAFWSSSEMRSLQVTKAWNMMGAFSQKQTLAGQKYFGLAEPSFAHFCYWFDQATLNGTGNTVAFGSSKNITVQSILDWMKGETGYIQKDFDKNRVLWPDLLSSATPDQIELFIMAKVRADMSREEFDTVVMCRRGTLALFKGWVNGSLRDYNGVFRKSTTPNIPPVVVNPDRDAKFLSIATKAGLESGAQALLQVKRAKYPKGNPRYWALFNIAEHSKNHRFHLIDADSGEIKSVCVAHGAGSDPDNNGLATLFSDTNGSHMSSLGTYRCSETIQTTNHGRALALDGLETSNAHARPREIIMHRADYVTDSSAGRSWGCPALSNKVTDEFIDKLNEGSFLCIYKG